MNPHDTSEDSREPFPEHLLSRAESALLSDLQPVMPMASVLHTSLGLLALAAFVIAAAVARLGWAGWNSSSGLQVSIVLGILALSMSLLAHSLSEQMAPGSARRFSTSLLLVLPLIALAAALAILYPSEPSPKFVSAGFRCWRAGVACAAGTAPLFWLVLRRGFPLAPIQYGATAGLLAGLTGVTVLTIECGYLDGLHLTTWHLGAGLASLTIGACAGWFVCARLRRAA